MQMSYSVEEPLLNHFIPTPTCGSCDSELGEVKLCETSPESYDTYGLSHIPEPEPSYNGSRYIKEVS